jgi:hypothetical protein
MRYQTRKRTGLVTLATVAVLLATTVAAEPVGANDAKALSSHTARAFSISDRGQLRLIRKHGFTLYEQGTASGTIRGAITVTLKIVSSSSVTVAVTISPGGGSISGYGTGSYHKGETAASFSGSLSVSRGSGSYEHAKGSGLRFSGTIARSNDAIAVSVSGSLSD